MSRSEPVVRYATTRITDDDEIHIECRFSDGQKVAAIVVDGHFPQLAVSIVDFLNGTPSPKK